MVTADSRVEYGSQKQKEEMMKLAGSGVRSEIFLLYKNNYVYTKIYILTRHPWQRLFSPHTHFYIGSLIFFFFSFLHLQKANSSKNTADKKIHELSVC